MTQTDKSLGLLVLRLGFSGMLLTHGIPKVLKLLQGDLSFADPIGIGEPLTFVLAIFAEVICSLLIIIGFKTRLAVIPIIITMAVVFFVVSAGQPLGNRESALLYLIGFLAIGLLGAGKYSVDRE